MISEDFEMGAKKVGSPFLQCLDDSEEFLLMDRVVFLSIIELVGVICNWACCFPSCAKTQHGASTAVTGISGDIYVRRLVFIINYGETVGAEDQMFDVFKCRLVFGGPCWKYSVTFLCGEGVRTLVYSARAGRKVAMYLVSPRNPLTLVAVVGWGQDAIWSVFRGSGLIPVPEMMCPRKHSLVANRLVLFWLQ